MAHTFSLFAAVAKISRILCYDFASYRVIWARTREYLRIGRLCAYTPCFTQVPCIVIEIVGSINEASAWFITSIERVHHPRITQDYSHVSRRNEIENVGCATLQNWCDVMCVSEGDVCFACVYTDECGIGRAMMSRMLTLNGIGLQLNRIQIFFTNKTVFDCLFLLLKVKRMRVVLRHWLIRYNDVLLLSDWHGMVYDLPSSDMLGDNNKMWLPLQAQWCLQILRVITWLERNIRRDPFFFSLRHPRYLFLYVHVYIKSCSSKARTHAHGAISGASPDKLLTLTINCR